MTDLLVPPSGEDSFQEPQRPPSLVRNTAFNIVASFVNLGVGLVVSPVLLVALGVQRYGLWSLLWAITGSLGLLDLRVGTAVSPLAATAWARGERHRVTQLASTGLLFYAFLGIVELGAVLTWTLMPSLVAWIPPPLRKEGVFALVAAAAVFAVNSLTFMFTGLLHAFQRFDLAARIAMVTTVSRGTLLVAVAWSGGGLRELVLAEGAVACLQCFVTVRMVRRLLPEIRLFRRPDPRAFRELISFGGKLQISHMAHLISLHADKILLSAFLGLTAVAYYDLGQKIAYVMRGLPLLLTSATMPVASAMEVKGDREELWNFYLKGTRALVYAATPLFIFTVTGAGAILFAWTGVTAIEARMAVWLLATGFYLSLISGMAYSIVIGIGKPELEMRRSLLAGGINLVLSASLIPLIGFAGAPLATAVGLTVGSWYLIQTFNAKFGRPFSTVFRLFRLPALAALPAAGGALVLLTLVNGGRGGALAGLAGSILIIGAVYAWVSVHEGIVSGDWLRSIPARLRAPAMKM
jgi:O-antigen/teichoic acid export membrane protein